MKKKRRDRPTARRTHKMRTCEVCGREYKAFPERGKNGGIIYRGECCYCHTLDYSRGDSSRGHLEFREF